MKYPLDYLDEHIKAPQHSTVFIGGTTYNMGRIKTTYNGMWLGYKDGLPFVEIRFVFQEKKTRFGDNVLAQVKSLEKLFRNAYKHMDSDTLVMVSSKRFIEWMNRGQYKWMDGLDVKAKLFTWFDAINPKLGWYNSLHPPYSLIREVLTNEKKEILSRPPSKEELSWTNIVHYGNIP
jgi:hypothetical protein